jgi:transposase
MTLQKTIEPLIKDTIVPGTCVYTDEYSIYARLHAWGYEHKRVTIITGQNELIASFAKGPNLL